MDELNGWSPPPEVTGCDLAVLPMGICEFDLFTGERLIHEEHPVLRFEATFEETLGIVAALDAVRVVLSHVEEMDCISYDDLLRVEERLREARDGRHVRLGRHDGRRVTDATMGHALARHDRPRRDPPQRAGAPRGLLGRAELWAVVKADGYGHGAVEVGRAALEAGATALGVATVAEALELRRALPERADRRSRPGRAPRARRGPRGPTRAVRVLGARRPKGSLSTSSSTRGWAAGGSPSSRRPALVSSA